MKLQPMLKILCAVILGVLIAAALVGCKQETATIYPCYFNADVADVDATAIRAAIEEAGWELQSSEPNDSYGNTATHIYRLITGDQKKVIAIHEFENAEQAEQAYVQDVIGTIFPATIFPDEYSMYSLYIRISNCLIMTVNNGHVELLELLGLGTVEPLEVPTENTQKLHRKIKSVDIEAAKTAMEADGYTFYPMEFIDSEEVGPTYVIVSPEQDRAYVYTLSAHKPMLGMSYTYYIYSIIERVALDYKSEGSKKGDDLYVGMHFVGFKDGSCILCYEDSFAEIEKYFAE